MSKVKQLLYKEAKKTINIEDLLKRIREAGECNAKEAAMLLLRFKSELISKLKLIVCEPANIHESNNADHFNLVEGALREVVTQGTFFNNEKAQADLRSYGFYFKDIASFLKSKEIIIGSTPPPPSQLTLYPAWSYKYAARSQFSKHELALLFRNTDPFGFPFFKEEEWPFRFDKESPYYEAMKYIDEGVINNFLTPIQSPDGVDSFAHQNIRTWCKKIGHSWCIPASSYFESSNEGVGDIAGSSLGENYARSIEECAAKQQEIAVQKERIVVMGRQISELDENLKKCIKENTELKSKYESKTSRDLSSFNKETLLKLLGAAALLLEVNVKQKPLKNIGKLRDDLGVKGATISEETLNKYLTESGKYLD